MVTDPRPAPFENSASACASPPGAVTPGFPEQLSAVIGLIYDTASDESLWPRLLESVAALVLESKVGTMALPDDVGLLGLKNIKGMNISLEPSAAEAYLLACLAPHFARSQEMLRTLKETEIERDVLERLMDRLPLGVAIVDGMGQAISMNRAMLALLQSDKPLGLRDGCLETHPPGALTQGLARVLCGQQEHASLRLAAVSDEISQTGSASTGGLSLWISHLGAGKENDRALVLAASPGSRALSTEALGAFFGLSAAESRLTQQLVLGQSIEEAAHALSISHNTAKSQLKKVFAKVGVKRQSDLVQAIYVSPLWLDLTGAEPMTLARHAELQSTSTQSGHLTPGGRLRLPDGRSIAWSDSGDPLGWPVVLCHAFLQGQHDRPPDDSVLTALGLRLIIPDRPGCGDSDPNPRGQMDDWPSDITHLLTHLGIDNFSVLSWSMGTPYALALARNLGDRVKALLLVSPINPLGDVSDLRFYAPKTRLILMVALFTPSLLPMLTRTLIKSVRKDVFAFLQPFLAEVPASEVDLFNNALFRSQRAKVLLKETDRDPELIAQNGMQALRGWNLGLPVPTMPCKIWHGDADPAVHWQAAQALSKALGGAPLRLEPGAGHHLIWCHWQAILQDLKDLRMMGQGKKCSTPGGLEA